MLMFASRRCQFRSDAGFLSPDVLRIYGTTGTASFIEALLECWWLVSFERTANHLGFDLSTEIHHDCI